MRRVARSLSCLLLAAGCLHVPLAAGADAESDALNLESAPASALEKSTRDTNFFVEGAFGESSRRYGLGSSGLNRLSLDYSHTARLGSGWQAVFSDRLDQIRPRDPARADGTINSLREAYLSWQREDGSALLEFGRINLRYGPGYGYNPTDFFRDGSLRAVTTADPFALRENRLGSVMLRGQRLWSGGSLSVAISPKLESRPSLDAWSLDLGSTNNRDRALVALGTEFSQRVSSQLLLYKQNGLSPTLGANFTALVSDAATAHMEWSRGREPSLLSRALTLNSPASTRNRLVGGVTYTTLGKLSLTAEYQYNGFGLNNRDWAALSAVPASQLAYLGEALRLQELAPRQAYLIYVTQKGLLQKDLDLTAYLRIDANDHSRLAWVELRHHWQNFDLTLQLQKNIGGSSSEFGILPVRGIMQILGTFYF
jgi:hypothetical protein